MRFVASLSGPQKSKRKSLEASHTNNSYLCEFSKLQTNVEYKFEVFAAYPDSNGESVNGIIKTQNKGIVFTGNLYLVILKAVKICAYCKTVVCDESVSEIYPSIPTAHHSNVENNVAHYKKSLKIPKGQSESVNRRRTDNTITKKKKNKKDKQ